MFSKISRKFLLAVTIFAVHWLEGHGYFFRRWESTPSASDTQHQSASSTPHHNEYRMNSFNWIHPVQQRPVVHDASPVANAAIPVPIAVPFPQHIIPFAMFSTVAHVPQPSISKAHHHHHANTAAIFTQPSAAAGAFHGSTTPATAPAFVKLSPYDTHNGLPYQLAAPAQATFQAVRFVPCLCSSGTGGGSSRAVANNAVGKDDRWTKNNNNNYYYESNGQFAHAAPLQAFHLLPCYCPLVRDIESQYPYVQQVSISSTDSTTNNGPSTVSTKS